MVACGIDAPDTFIKALGASAEITPVLPDGWTVVSTSRLMTAPMRTCRMRKPRQATSCKSQSVKVLTDDGDMAASGKGAIVDDW